MTTQCKSRGQDSIYENSCKVSVAEGHVAQRLYDYGPEFYVAFKVRVLEHPSAHWNSILAITNSDNWGRFPAVWFQKNRFFHITTTDTANYDFHGVKLNHEYNIVISQQYNMKNELIHRITINYQEVRSIVNTWTVNLKPSVKLWYICRGHIHRMDHLITLVRYPQWLLFLVND